MSNSTQNATVLLNRILGLKEASPLLLILDSIAQSSYHLINELIHNKPTNLNIIYLSYETLQRPSYSSHYIQAWDLTLEKVIVMVNAVFNDKLKNLIIIDSINYLQVEEITKVMSELIKPNSTLLTTFHTSLPEQDVSTSYNQYPTVSKILTFFASSIFEIISNIDDEDEESLDNLNKLELARNLNTDVFRINLINRRKSGRSLTYNFEIDSTTHEYKHIISKASSGSGTDDTSMLKDLTTFNLSTSNKQKLARSQVELPYLEAQSFNSGGAIIYEFEKDDDYDEEDPYEDPF